MPKFDGTGPEGDGSLSGRKLGNCRNASDDEKLHIPGRGMGKKRHSEGNKGKGKRLKSGKQ